jgi:hypothetical protein
MPRKGSFVVDVLELWLSPRAKRGPRPLFVLQAPEPIRHDKSLRIEDNPNVIRLRDRREAKRECRKYDALKSFGDHVVNAWRGSMSPDDFYPYEAPDGPYESYAQSACNDYLGPIL